MSSGNQDYENDPQVYVWPEPSDEPFEIPQSVAIDIALRVSQARVRVPSSIHILDPPRRNTLAQAGHDVLLQLLDSTSISYKTLVEELDYPNEASLASAIAYAESETAKGELAWSRIDVARMNYKKELGNWTIAKTLKEQEATVNQPTLSKAEQAQFIGFRQGDEDARAALEQQYDPIITSEIDALDASAPADVIDIAWAVFDKLVRTADLTSTQSFSDSLRKALQTAFEAVITAHRVAELTKDLSMRDYNKSLDEYEATIDAKTIKTTSLKSATTETVLEAAQTYLDSRLSRNTERPIKGYFRIKPEVRPRLKHSLHKSYAKFVANKLKVSAHMHENSQTEFQLAQLPPEKLVEFFSVTVLEVAEPEIERMKGHLR